MKAISLDHEIRWREYRDSILSKRMKNTLNLVNVTWSRSSEARRSEAILKLDEARRSEARFWKVRWGEAKRSDSAKKCLVSGSGSSTVGTCLRCTSCRLKTFFDVKMWIEWTRTDMILNEQKNVEEISLVQRKKNRLHVFPSSPTQSIRNELSLALPVFYQ